MPRGKNTKTSDKIWEKMKTEYITDDKCSYRSLEKKYGIPFSRIRSKGHEEKWQQQRAEFKSKATQKSIDSLSDQYAEDCTRAFRVASSLLEKIEASVQELNVKDVKSLKLLTASIRDLKEIGMFRSEMDRLEQLARIKKLQKDAEEEEKDDEIIVTFMENGYGD